MSMSEWRDLPTTVPTFIEDDGAGQRSHVACVETERNDNALEFAVYRSADGLLQVAVEHGAGGLRLFGPKFDGRSTPLLRFALDERARDELRKLLSGEANGTTPVRTIDDAAA